ncbi:MAG TPA: hypothetical protein DEB25_07035 [Desulfobulbaceae bacterium]|nr:hypothetical protein [Desulfobulbaceae bacterium]
MTTQRNEYGFTLIEAMIAVAVLMLGVLVLEKNIIAQVFYNNATRLASTGLSGSASLVERLQALSYDNDWLRDVDHAGLNSLDATVDAGGRIIADHAVNLDADGQIARNAAGNEVIINSGQALDDLPAGGMFTVFWNVFDDPDRPDIKIIRVISRWRDKAQSGNVHDDDQINNRQMVIDYVKLRL